MKTKNKSLLIHHDETTETTASIVVDEKDVVKKTKEFLKRIAKSYKEAEESMYRPLGVILKAADGEQEYAHAVAYERENFVIVEPHAKAEAAKLYGNWNEALTSAHKFLSSSCEAGKSFQITLDKYIKK
jgi:hypothetical protein